MVCKNCGRPKGEHAREALKKSDEYRWEWHVNACPVGPYPFSSTDVFEEDTWLNA